MDGFEKFSCHRTDGLIPRDTLPFSLSPPARPFQGSLETVGMVEPLRLRKTLGTQGPAAQRRIGVPFDPLDATVFDVDDHAAAAMVHPGAIGFYDHFVFPLP
jgi:hypothetical protein